MSRPESEEWFRHAVIYQIYPRSFADSNGDGVGDLKGITGKLDYLADLGVDGIWLSPIYASPMADFGYDVSDYFDIDPVFGTLDDFDELVREAHARDIKVLMDLIPNHTSEQHPWFIESRSSKNNPKRDWYVWKDPKADGSEPNNWGSVFGGRAWTLDEATGQYYLHSFLKQQPDLNWANPEVHEAVKGIVHFWYDRGVDGFRVDAILFTSKDLEFRDNPEAVGEQEEGLHSRELKTARSHGVAEHLPEYIRVLTSSSEGYPGRFLFLEAYPDEPGPSGYIELYDYFDNKSAASFYFGLVHQSEDLSRVFGSEIERFQALLPPGGVAAYVLGNHDVPRVATRIGPAAARAAAVELFTLPGSKFIYYGEEIGMENVEVPPEKVQDPGRDARGLPMGRDPERTPMQWSPDEHGGFSAHEPWLPLAPDYRERNVEALSGDEHSVLSLYKKLIQIHASYPALKVGSFVSLGLTNGTFGFLRETSEQRVAVLFNFTDSEQQITTQLGAGTVLVSSVTRKPREQMELGSVTLQPYEATVLELN